MNIARCTIDGKVYNAIEFSNLPIEGLLLYRRSLVCVECGGPSFFRKASHIGRGSHFGARPHACGCKQATQDYVRYPQYTEDGEELQYGLADKIVLDLNYGAPQQAVYAFVARYASIQDDSQHMRHEYRQHGENKSSRPSTFLRNLINSPEFRNSNKIVEYGGHYLGTIRDLFVPLLSARSQHVGYFRGFWGMLSDVQTNKRKTTIWFNSGGHDNIGFCLSETYSKDLFERYQVESYEDLAGAYILVFGVARHSYDGKLYCDIVNLNNMALRLT